MKRRFVTGAHRVGATEAARVLAEQVWWTKTFFGLRCDLTQSRAIRPAKLPIVMEPVDPRAFDGYEEEFERVEGQDCIQVLLRLSLCDAGVETLYVGRDDGGDPAYGQWLVEAENQHLINAHMPGRYPDLRDDEVLLEGAYTFTRFRQLGLMADGMGQLLDIARNNGATAAYTYVAPDNVPSLRGCAAVGFDLDHIRRSVRRLGVRRGGVDEPDEDAFETWNRATAPRS